MASNKQNLETVKALARLFRIEHEQTDQPYIFMHADDYSPLVEALLRQKQCYRESDAMLYHDLLAMLGEEPGIMTAHVLLKQIHYGHLPHWEAISRVKRKLQLDNPEFRGRVWRSVTDYEAQQDIPFPGGESHE